jgi:hypothetical protein
MHSNRGSQWYAAAYRTERLAPPGEALALTQLPILPRPVVSAVIVPWFKRLNVMAPNPQPQAQQVSIRRPAMSANFKSLIAMRLPNKPDCGKHVTLRSHRAEWERLLNHIPVGSSLDWRSHA